MHPALTRLNKTETKKANQTRIFHGTQTNLLTVASFRTWRGSVAVCCVGPGYQLYHLCSDPYQECASAGNSTPHKRISGIGHR